MKRISTGLFLLLVFGFFAGCSSSSDSGGGTNPLEIPSGGDLTGQWVRCSVPGAGSQIQTREYAGTQTVVTLDATPETGDCSGAVSQTDVLTFDVTFLDTAEVSLSSATVNATRGSVTYAGRTRVYLTTDAVTSANSNTLCGYSDWVINVPRDIVGTSCATANGTVLKFLWFIDDAAAPNRLYIANITSAADGDGYPTVLDPAFSELLP